MQEHFSNFRLAEKPSVHGFESPTAMGRIYTSVIENIGYRFFGTDLWVESVLICQRLSVRRMHPVLLVTGELGIIVDFLQKEKIAMKMKNVRVFAVNRDLEDGFNVYLDFSGQREYLVSRRHNGILYEILKDGISVEKLKRTKPHQLGAEYGFHFSGRNSAKLESQLNHLNNVIEEYINEVVEYDNWLDDECEESFGRMDSLHEDSSEPDEGAA